ncbi:MAG TPA: ubiquinol-cytochrome C chaperone family protein [Allosphingosinicella sp.]|uniref:ubiquinol-cytochrome C chaperone family protein n=1 Tax=Allosphingosinicella sp. TaxID=2823234 RepID=UPI002EDAD7F8
MSFFSRLFGSRPAQSQCRPLYDRIVRIGRDPAWYIDGAVPDTLDGRFDMIAAVMALVLLRLEREGGRTAQAAVELAEIFIEDMDGTVRQIGIGDLMVGKHVGKMMGALGGRLTAFRDAAQAGGDFEEPVRRNIFHDAPPSEHALGFVSRRLERFHQGLVARPAEEILRGEVPQP